MTKRALLSVANKAGITAFGQALVDLGYELLSTGGTSKALELAGLPVTQVSQVTGFPEMMDGRVKTLHPNIHGGILARPITEHLKQAEALGIELIDLVAVNLYPFEETIRQEGIQHDEAVEEIDIGGPAMVRSAAKNHERVTVLVDPEDYPAIVDILKETGNVPADKRAALAAKAFRHTAAYDACIANYFETYIQKGH